MLPVGGIIVGVIALLLSGYAAISLAKVNRTLAAHEEKVARIDTLESQVNSSSAASEKASRDIAALTRSTQDAFNQVGGDLGNIHASLTKLEESAKAAPVKAAKSGSSGPVVAGEGEYVIKSGDSFAKIARSHGCSIADIQAVNPGVDSSKLHVGQKIKLPKK